MTPLGHEFSAVDPATRVMKDWVFEVTESGISVREKGSALEDGHLHFVQLVDCARLNSVGVLQHRLEVMRETAGRMLTLMPAADAARRAM